MVARHEMPGKRGNMPRPVGNGMIAAPEPVHRPKTCDAFGRRSYRPYGTGLLRTRFRGILLCCYHYSAPRGPTIGQPLYAEQHYALFGYYARCITGKKTGSQDPPRELLTHLRLSRLPNLFSPVRRARHFAQGRASHSNSVVLFRR
jgi:hypothetical protein